MMGLAGLSGKAQRRRMLMSGLLVLASAGLAGCGVVGSLVDSAEVRSADRHATIAGEVMVRENWERSANDAAYLVVGSGLDDTIDALDVEGTTYHGKVVLRITVDPEAESGDASVTRCYAYTFSRGSDDALPAHVDCTDRVVVLTTPVPEPRFDAAATARLTATLRRLLAQHTTDAPAIQRRVAAVFGPPVTVAVGPAGLDHGTNNGTMIVNLDVPSHDECMWAIVTVDGHVTAQVGNWRDCAN